MVVGVVRDLEEGLGRELLQRLDQVIAAVDASCIYELPLLLHAGAESTQQRRESIDFAEVFTVS